MPYNRAKHGAFLYPLCLRRRLSINSCGAWLREDGPRLPFLWLGPPFSHRQLLIDFPHGGRSAVWGRSLAFRNKPHCSLCSHAFLPLIFLLQPLAFLLELLLFLQCKSVSCLSVTKVDMHPAHPPSQRKQAY